MITLPKDPKERSRILVKLIRGETVNEAKRILGA